MADTTHSFVVDETHAGARLDKFLSAHLPDHTRSYLQQLIADECVLRNGATITSASAKVKQGERYELTIPEPITLDLEPVPMELDIIYEDEHLIVINKAVGVAVHPAAGTYEPTLVHGLLGHCGDSLSGIGGVARPGIVHRIDKDTSGLLVVAKTDQAHQHLSAQLKDRSLSRTYQAVCWGVPSPPEGSIEGNIGRSPKNRKKMAVLTNGGKEALTHYKVEEIYTHQSKQALIPFASLLTCKLDSGRTHQIRVHLTHAGHGLIGDSVYGSSTESRMKTFRIIPKEKDCFLLRYRRQALHACMLTLWHPALDKSMSFEAPMPDDMKELITCLKSLH